MNDKEYFAHAAISRSQIADFYRSRQQYYRQHVAGTAAPRKASAALEFGTWFHTAVLEPDRWADRLVIIPPDCLTKAGGRNCNAFKDWRDDQHGDAYCLKASELEEIAGMADAAKAELQPVLGRESLIVEQPRLWTHEVNGHTFEFKSKADAQTELATKTVLLDLKSTRDSTARAFRRSIMSFDYWLQDAHYSAGVRALTGRYPDFLFAACDKRPETGYRCRVFSLDAEGRDRAAEVYEQVLEELAAAYQSGDWSDRDAGAVEELSIWL